MGILKKNLKWLQCKRGSKTYEKIIFKRIKLRKNNYANKSTDKRNVFMRGYTSPIRFLESFLFGGKLHNSEEKSGSESKENPENKN